MTRRQFILFFNILLILLASSAGFSAGLKGQASISYFDYAREKNNKKYTAGSLYQYYTLRYSTEKLLRSGRLGRFSVGLGAELGVLDSEYMQKSNSDSLSKFTYSGRLLLSPGGLPFFLDLNAAELSSVRTQDFRTTATAEAADMPGVPFYLRDGKNSVISAVFMAGIRNGSYGGRYREILSKYPKLLFDYKQQTVEDTESELKSHYRKRDLAFVSLNKKKNWFHYRYKDYTNYLNHLDDRQQRTYMLGTVNHLLNREWINITNWIRISADLALHIYEDSALKNNRSESYDLNLFIRADRRKWNLYTNLNYERRSTETELIKQVNLPLYLKLRPNRDTSAQINFLSTSRTNQLTQDEQNYHISLLTDTYKRAPFDLRYGLSFDSFLDEEKGRDSKEISFDVSTRSNRSFYKKDTIVATYSFVFNKNERPSDKKSVGDSWNTTFYINWNHSFSSKTTLGLSQRNTLNKMENSKNDYKSNTSFTLKIKNSNRTSNVFDAAYDYYKNRDNDGDISTISLGHLLTSKISRLKTLVVGTSILSSNVYHLQPGRKLEAIRYVSYRAKRIISNTAEFSYAPTRSLLAKFKSYISLLDTESENLSEMYSFKQSLTYSRYTANGIVRKLYGITEELLFESLGTGWYRSIALNAVYYPTKVHTISVGTTYTLTPDDTSSIGASFALSCNWQKMKASFAYSFATEDAETSDTNIQIIRAKISRTF